jgi:hypothetical protein
MQVMQTLFGFLATGVLGSPHCVVMCGGFVAAYSLRGKGWALGSHLAFHLGRMTTATALGLLAGTLGWGLERGGKAVGIHGVFPWVFGGLMIVIGLVQLGLVPLDRLIPAFSQKIERPMASVLQKAALGRSLLPVLTLGLMIGLLPCHLSYGVLGMAVTAAAQTGSVLVGVLGMMLFVLGTAPLLVAFGIASRGLGAVLRDRVVKVAAVILILMGIYTIYRAWPSAAPSCCHGGKASNQLPVTSDQ